MTSKVTYNGELSTTMIHVNSKSELTTDAPTDNRGKGESFSPTDLTATSLASCMLTIMGVRALDNGWEIGGSTIEVEKIMASNPRKIAQINLNILMKHNLDNKESKVLLEKVALTCPVALSLHPEILQQVEFCW